MLAEYICMSRTYKNISLCINNTLRNFQIVSFLEYYDIRGFFLIWQTSYRICQIICLFFKNRFFITDCGTLRSQINGPTKLIFLKKKSGPHAVIRTSPQSWHLLILDFQVSLQKNLNSAKLTLVFEIQ